MPIFSPRCLWLVLPSASVSRGGNRHLRRRRKRRKEGSLARTSREGKAGMACAVCAAAAGAAALIRHEPHGGYRGYRSYRGSEITGGGGDNTAASPPCPKPCSFFCLLRLSCLGAVLGYARCGGRCARSPKPAKGGLFLSPSSVLAGVGSCCACCRSCCGVSGSACQVAGALFVSTAASHQRNLCSGSIPRLVACLVPDERPVAPAGAGLGDGGEEWVYY